ncbi:MAG TPA: SCO family protein [Steroidobacteraceae bacterium]|jgi:protein SCO1/2|nr:SCO family protein [Steroidobacteraceae bacterium]
MSGRLYHRWRARWAVGLLALSGCVWAHTLVRAPADLLGRVGFDQELGALVPQQVMFRDTHGASVRLGSVLASRPTLLVPAYYRCTNLCSVVRAGVANAVAGSGLHPGRDFAVVLVSFDPRESTQDARDAQQLDAHAHPDADVTSFQYLTGPQDSITALMRSIGFRYIYDARNDQFDHDAGIVLLTPGGQVAQYFFGVQFQPEALRLALVNAAHGRIGTFVDHLLLLCCDYDVSTGRYSVTIQHVMRVLGIATVLALAALVLFLRGRTQDRPR